MLNLSPKEAKHSRSGRIPVVDKHHPGPGVLLAPGPAAMDQTVITSCSKDKLQSDLQGIFNQRVVCWGKKAAEQTGEVSMKKNERVGGVRDGMSVCVVCR